MIPVDALAVAGTLAVACGIILSATAWLAKGIPGPADEPPCPGGCRLPLIVPWYWNSTDYLCVCGTHYRLTQTMHRRWVSQEREQNDDPQQDEDEQNGTYHDLLAQSVASPYKHAARATS